MRDPISVGPAGVRLLLVDNYDSFTWNLAQYLAELGARVDVRLNDRVDLPWVRNNEFDGIVVSPGPGRPEQAGISLDLIRGCGAGTPLLGVCLGHQAIALAHGARVVRAPTPMHGKTSRVHHDGSGLFAGLPDPFVATRYHSLIVDERSLDESLRVTAWTADGAVMGLRHRGLPLHGVQFHPESVLTTEGKKLLGNFLELVGRERSRTKGGPAAERLAAVSRTGKAAPAPGVQR